MFKSTTSAEDYSRWCSSNCQLVGLLDSSSSKTLSLIDDGCESVLKLLWNAGAEPEATAEVEEVSEAGE